MQAAGGSHMRDRRLPPLHADREPLPAGRSAVRGGAGMPVVNDATWATARARRGDIFLPRVAGFFLRAVFPA